MAPPDWSSQRAPGTQEYLIEHSLNPTDLADSAVAINQLTQSFALSMIMVFWKERRWIIRRRLHPRELCRKPP